MSIFDQYEELTPTNIRQAISDVRWNYVDSQVQRSVDRREGEFTHDEVEAWQQEAVNRWNKRHVVLHRLWKAIDEGRVSIAEQDAEVKE